MFFILACLFLARRYGTSAAPIASSLADPLAYDAPIFTRDECSNDCFCPGRSVWDILWSCLATTFAVTWVSVHPNVPYLEEKSWPLLKRRIFLMCLALLAPEAMIMWAFKQWRGAVEIRETINKARPKSCVQWTMTHAHFLQMGGFKLNSIFTGAVEFYSHEDSFYAAEKEGIWVEENVIRFYVLRRLLEEQLIDFPDTTAKEIEDRSKGDGLSKGVALLQITWFIVQLVARAHQHLAITEIELTTAALAGLNSILYLFWWSKPLDVRCPIVIRTKELERKLVKKGRSDHRHGAHAHSRSAETWTFTEDEFRLRDYLRDSLFRVAQAIISALATHVLHTISIFLRLLRYRTGKVVKPELHQSTTNEPQDSQGTRSHFRFGRTCALVVTKLFYLPHLLMFVPMEMILDPHPYWDVDYEGFDDAKDKMDNKPALQLLFCKRDMRWIMRMMFYSEDAEARPLMIFSAIAGAAFGSIHCIAWHFDFPSHVERILWRTASLSVVGVCLCIVIVGIPIHHFIYKYREEIDGFNYFMHDTEYFWRSVKTGVDTIPAIVYSLSRASLLILALISLRNLPDSAFKTVTWTMFIPHV